MKKRRILIIEDDKIDRMAFERYASRQKFPYDYVIGASVGEATEILDKESFDAVVLDYMLGDGTAFDLFEMLKSKDIPFIVVTGRGDEEIAVHAMKEGAYDYLIKDAESNHLKVLQVTVDEAIKKKHLENLIKEANLELERLAKLDSLTGISNYRQFEEVYRLEWRRSVRNVSPISLVLIDVDFFKLYNDTYGHQAGDVCLKKIAVILQESCQRPSDLAARYGGEEFILILSDTKMQGAETLAKRIRKAVEDLKIPHKKSKISKHVTISLGCACTVPTKDNDPKFLIRAADEALYNSKKDGRNRITISEICR